VFGFAFLSLLTVIGLSACGGGEPRLTVKVEGATAVNAANLEGGSLVLKSLSDTNPYAVASIDGQYDLPFSVSAELTVDRHPTNQVCRVTTAPSGTTIHCAFTPINDTGLSVCRAQTPCPAEDAGAGRDAIASRLTKVSAGSSQDGFDFTRICNNGIEEGRAGCAISTDARPGPLATDWGCTRDNVTGLVWRGVDYGTRSTFNAARNLAPALRGESWCGREGWGLPSVHQLQSVLNSAGVQRGDYRIAAPLTALPVFDFNARNQAESLAAGRPSSEQDNFSDAVRSGFWTANQVFDDDRLGWAVLFQGAGRVKYEDADLPALRVVPVSGHDLPKRFADPYHGWARWVFNSRDGTLLDRRSGLMWMVCSSGRSYDPSTARCTGNGLFTFEQALALPTGINTDASANRGYDDWRLPNRAELASLVDYEQRNPAVSSDNALTASLRSDLEGNPGSFWTSSWVPSNGAGDAFVVNFTTGEVALTPELQTLLRARLVRNAR